MSLRPHIIEPVPEETARVARAAFPKGPPYLTFRDALGPIFQDEDFSALFPARGQQRTDSTHVLAAVRVLNRLELVAETLRAALNAVATVAPDWLQAVSPLAWYERYSRRIEESRLPKATTAREAYAQTVGEDGFLLLDALETPAVPEGLRALPSLEALRRTWQ